MKEGNLVPSHNEGGTWEAGSYRVWDWDIHAKGNNLTDQWLSKHSYMGPEQGRTLRQAPYSCETNGKCTLLAYLCHYLCSRYQNTHYEPHLLEGGSLDRCVHQMHHPALLQDRLVCLHHTNAAPLSKVKAMGGLHSLKERKGRHLSRFSQAR